VLTPELGAKLGALEQILKLSPAANQAVMLLCRGRFTQVRRSSARIAARRPVAGGPHIRTK
jgi:hypothetical protein